MDGVPAWQHRCRPHAVKQVFKAHWAVLAHAVLHADVVALRSKELCLAQHQGFHRRHACLAQHRIMLGTARSIVTQLCISSFQGVTGSNAHAQRSLCRQQACWGPAAQEESDHICELCPPEALCQAMAHQSETGCKQRARRDQGTCREVA